MLLSRHSFRIAVRFAAIVIFLIAFSATCTLPSAQPDFISPLNRIASLFSAPVPGDYLLPATVHARTNSTASARRFTFYDTNARPYKRVRGSLIAKGAHISVWSDKPSATSAKNAARLVERFDKKIYRNNIDYFADKSVRKQVTRLDVLVTELDDLDGYFDSANLSGDNSYLVFLNSSLLRDDFAESCNTVAHEFEHVLFYSSGGADVAWLDEGLAVYAEYINGSYPAAFVEDFKKNPKIALTAQTPSSSNYYGAAFLFIANAVKHVRASNNSVGGFTQDLIANSEDGIAGVDRSLERYIKDSRFDSFAEIYQPQQLLKSASAIQARR